MCEAGENSRKYLREQKGKRRHFVLMVEKGSRAATDFKQAVTTAVDIIESNKYNIVC